MNRHYIYLLVATLILCFSLVACQSIDTLLVVDEKGMGIPRESIQVPFEGLGFVFGAQFVDGGKYRVNGSTHNPEMGLELTGPEDDLSQITYMGELNYDTMQTCLDNMSLVLDLSLPEWTERSKWLLETLGEGYAMASEGQANIETTFSTNGREVRLVILEIETKLMVVFTVRQARQ